MNYLFVGLGNIGPEYKETRHNIGFMVLDKLARMKGVEFDSDRYAFTTDFKFKGRKITLVKPTTYMNLSGKAVNYWMKTLKIPIENVMIVVDDLALPFGSLRMRGKGSGAGHNGLQNIQDILGHNKYPRLRFGIGDDFPKGRQVDYVLSDFTPKEREEVDIFIDKSCEMLLSFTAVGINQTMTNFND
ncbi:MAG: aminoacyl-tRNA hydrolase [Flammeovirgaceae bacterium]|nr:aminoacyl-tRNA hydrolase [Flammeovirgaceae bacterium]